MPPPAAEVIAPSVSPEVRVEKLENLVADGARDPVIQAAARRIVGASAGDPVQAVVDWQARAIPYAADTTPGDAETYYTAAEVLRRGRGDCKQKSVFVAAILRALGYHARAVWLDQESWAESNHVAVEACLPRVRPVGASDFAVKVYAPERGPSCDPDGWAWIETTLPGARVGEHPYAALARLHPSSRTGVTPPTTARHPTAGAPRRPAMFRAATCPLFRPAAAVSRARTHRAPHTAPAHAQSTGSPTGSLTVNVTPANASVVVRDGSWAPMTPDDSRPNYFPGLAPGPYGVSAQLNGQSALAATSVTAGMDTTVALSLTPGAPALSDGCGHLSDAEAVSVGLTSAAPVCIGQTLRSPDGSTWGVNRDGAGHYVLVDHTPADHTPADHTPADHTPADHTPVGGGHPPPTASSHLGWWIAGSAVAAGLIYVATKRPARTRP